MITSALLVRIALVLVIALVTLAAAIALGRAGQRLRHARRSRTVDALRPRVAALVAEVLDLEAGAENPLTALARELGRHQRRVLDGIVLGYLLKIRGPARLPLLELLEYTGAVRRARRRLRSRSWVRRAAAAEVLGRTGQPELVADLAPLLADPAAQVRAVAAAGLAGGTASDPVVTALLATVHGAHRVPAGVLVETLLRLGPAVAPPLAAALGSGSGEEREVAAEALGLLGAAQAAPALVAVLSDPAVPTGARARAATALGRLGVPSALPALAACLAADQPDPVRLAAAAGLAELGSPAAVEPLTALLAGPRPLAAAGTAALRRLGRPGERALGELAERGPDSPAGRHAAAELARLRLAAPPDPALTA